MEKALHRMFYDPKNAGGFAGRKQVIRQAQRKGIRPRDVKYWLDGQPSYTLHRPVHRNFPRSPVMVVDGLDEQWQADLVDVQRLASENNGYRYWLTAMDILSRYAWIVPIKNKTGMDVVRAFQKIFREGRQPRVLQTD